MGIYPLHTHPPCAVTRTCGKHLVWKRHIPSFLPFLKEVWIRWDSVERGQIPAPGSRSWRGQDGWDQGWDAVNLSEIPQRGTGIEEPGLGESGKIWDQKWLLQSQNPFITCLNQVWNRDLPAGTPWAWEELLITLWNIPFCPICSLSISLGVFSI